MDQVAIINPDAKVAGMACKTKQDEHTLIPLDCYGRDIEFLEDRIVIKNLIVPHAWFEAVQFFDEKHWNDIVEAIRRKEALDLSYAQ
ncbi:hypothetical protein [Alicyclobacillus shizuokensis]|uniref:hypothetical protein n=1 Tax=Alicyclobacillus shizuokensis TaxID=392014 RepID=UPI0008305623|nr:hypothetical protein [Alicyclobacillus shizuokensis]